MLSCDNTLNTELYEVEQRTGHNPRTEFTPISQFTRSTEGPPLSKQEKNTRMSTTSLDAPGQNPNLPNMNKRHSLNHTPLPPHMISPRFPHYQLENSQPLIDDTHAPQPNPKLSVHTRVRPHGDSSSADASPPFE